MQRLSSRMTFFYKRVFPVFWFGFIAVFVVVWASAATASHRSDMWLPMISPLFMAIIGFVIFKRFLFDLVDEAWLDGDQLVVKNRGEQTRVPLADVMNVNASIMVNPPRVTLMLRTESRRLGNAVSFMPVRSQGFFAAFKPSPVATDLIHRIDALRRRPA